jgi:hypothetical protein
VNKKPLTLFEQVIVTSELTRELRGQRYGAIERGDFDPGHNRRLPRIIDQALDMVDSGTAGREYLMKAVDRRSGKNKSR